MREYYSYNYLKFYEEENLKLSGVICEKEQVNGFSFDLDEKVWEEINNQFCVRLNLKDKDTSYYLNAYQNGDITISSHTFERKTKNIIDKVVYKFEEFEVDYMKTLINELLEFKPITFNNGDIKVELKSYEALRFWLSVYSNENYKEFLRG